MVLHMQYIFSRAKHSGHRKWFKKNPDVILHINQDQGLNFKPFFRYLPESILGESRRDEIGCGKK